MNLLMPIFGLIAIVSAISAFQAVKNKNLLTVVFGVASAAIFGWFVVMTVLNAGYPTIMKH